MSNVGMLALQIRYIVVWKTRWYYKAQSSCPIPCADCCPIPIALHCCLLSKCYCWFWCWCCLLHGCLHRATCMDTTHFSGGHSSLMKRTSSVMMWTPAASSACCMQLWHCII